VNLAEVASLVRSKNAGPFQLTFDVMFEDLPTYERVVRANVLTAEFFARTFHCPAGRVDVFLCPNARAVKITIPRPMVQGTFGDADLHGGQQYAPLLDLEIPGPPAV
jgi:hypothetical protein